MENSLVFSVLVIKVDVLNNSHYLAQGTSASSALMSDDSTN